MSDNLWLALEGGGTRSQAALLDGVGHVVHIVNSADVNMHFTTLQESQAAVLAAVKGVLRGAQISGARVTHFVSALVDARFGAELLGEILPNASYHYYEEQTVVFARAGLYRPHGVAVVAGTGATAWAVRAGDGRECVYGGWGSLLGDEGSGYALGLAGLRAAIRVFEGRAEAPSRLFTAVLRHFGFAEPTFREDLVFLAYHKPLTRAEIAALAAVVTGLAAQGDPLAARLTAEAAADLTALALHAARRLFRPEEPFDVAVAGGLTNAGELLLGPFRQGFAQEFPRAILHIGAEPPAVALGRLALYDQRAKNP
jgi:N-acetylglucosamine kinase-like BadF-type ATPase